RNGLLQSFQKTKSRGFLSKELYLSHAEGISFGNMEQPKIILLPDQILGIVQSHWRKILKIHSLCIKEFRSKESTFVVDPNYPHLVAIQVGQVCDKHNHPHQDQGAQKRHYHKGLVSHS